MFSCDWRKFAYGNTNSSCVKSCRSCDLGDADFTIRTLVFLIPLLPKTPFFHLLFPIIWKRCTPQCNFIDRTFLVINRFPRNTHLIDPFQRDTTTQGEWDCNANAAERSWAELSWRGAVPCRHRIMRALHYSTKTPLSFSLSEFFFSEMWILWD